MNTPLDFDPDEQLAAVAKRAFHAAPPRWYKRDKPHEHHLDVARLLPFYEARIGTMMAEAVPKGMRPYEAPPGWSEYTLRLIAERNERIERTAALIEAGLDAHQISAAMGWAPETTRQYFQILGVDVPRRKPTPETVAAAEEKRYGAKRYATSRAIQNAIGQEFGHRTLLGEEPRHEGKARVRVRCQCGREDVIDWNPLRGGRAGCCADCSVGLRAPRGKGKPR